MAGGTMRHHGTLYILFVSIILGCNDPPDHTLFTVELAPDEEWSSYYLRLNVTGLSNTNYAYIESGGVSNLKFACEIREADVEISGWLHSSTAADTEIHSICESANLTILFTDLYYGSELDVAVEEKIHDQTGDCYLVYTVYQNDG
ncbi:hypothetical protein HN699_04235 [Candidatus Uhrbacteria bacterium]|nr:hypothetical protein [Candidatus Uhrbacteria bacterium]